MTNYKILSEVRYGLPLLAVLIAISISCGALSPQLAYAQSQEVYFDETAPPLIDGFSPLLTGVVEAVDRSMGHIVVDGHRFWLIPDGRRQLDPILGEQASRFSSHINLNRLQVGSQIQYVIDIYGEEDPEFPSLYVLGVK